MEKDSLDLNLHDFKRLLDKSTDLVLELFTDLDQQKGYHDYPQETVASWFNEPLPQEGMEQDALLDFVKEKILNTATGNVGPNMYAYVMGGGNQMGIVGEKLMATINQNQTKWHLAPALTEVEKRVISWTSELLGYTPEAGGVLVSGGSAANLTGLTVARNLFFEKLDIRRKGLFNMKPFTVYASVEAHSCIDKSIELLGIGSQHLRKIPTNPDFTIQTSLLEKQILEDQAAGFRPFCIVGTAGTVNTGAIDDLEALANLAEKHKMWFHVDGAYGALVASLEAFRPRYKGLERANSIALDFHKWLYQPFEVGCTLVRNWKALRQTYFKQADYLDTTLEVDKKRLEFNEHYFQLSRNAKAFKVWLSIKAYGIKAIKAMIQKDIDLTHYLARQIKSASDFELNALSDLAVVCFRYVGNAQTELEIVDLNQKLIPALEEDGRVFITGTKLNGRFVLRACLINHRKNRESTDYLLEVIRECGKKLR